MSIWYTVEAESCRLGLSYEEYVGRHTISQTTGKLLCPMSYYLLGDALALHLDSL